MISKQGQAQPEALPCALDDPVSGLNIIIHTQHRPFCPFSPANVRSLFPSKDPIFHVFPYYLQSLECRVLVKEAHIQRRQQIARK